MGLLAFALAQVAYGGTVLLAYVQYYWARIGTGGGDGVDDDDAGHFSHGHAAKVPSWSVLAPGRVSSESLWLIGLFQAQSVVKHIATEGEKIVLVLAHAPMEHGVYAIVANLGSLVVRFLFQPIEENCAVLFSKLGGTKRDMAEATRILAVVVKTLMHIGLLLACFGHAYSFLAIDILYGPSKSTTAAPAVLATYACYIPFMAVNGVTEAFVHSVATAKELSRQNGVMLASSALHLGLLYVLSAAWGNHGFIAANMVNMALRVASSLLVVRTRVPSLLQWLRGCMPHRVVALVFVLAAAAAHAANVHLCCVGWMWRGVHVLVGVVLVAVVAAAHVVFERPMIRDVRAVLAGRTSGAGDKDKSK